MKSNLAANLEDNKAKLQSNLRGLAALAQKTKAMAEEAKKNSNLLTPEAISPKNETQLAIATEKSVSTATVSTRQATTTAIVNNATTEQSSRTLEDSLGILKAHREQSPFKKVAPSSTGTGDWVENKKKSSKSQSCCFPFSFCFGGKKKQNSKESEPLLKNGNSKSYR